MARHLAHDVHAIPKPAQLRTGRNRKDRRLAILALIPVLSYVLAIESETRFSVVW
jgi:hypothetical protein